MHMQASLTATRVLREDAYKLGTVCRVADWPAASTCSPVQVEVTIFCSSVVPLMSPVWQGRRCSMHGRIVPISKVLHHRAAFVHAASPACGRVASQQQQQPRPACPDFMSQDADHIAASTLLLEPVNANVGLGSALRRHEAGPCFREHLLLTCTAVPGPGERPTGQRPRRCRGKAAHRWHQMQWTTIGSLANGTGQAHVECALWVWGWQS